MRLLSCLAAALLAASPAFSQTTDKSRYSLASPTPPDQLRELSTDRPDKTESPYTVDAGHVQIELDFANYTRDRDGGGDDDPLVETAGLVPFNLKLGLTNSTDLQLLIEPYVRRRIDDRETESGFGDVTVRLKHNLWGNDGGRTALALMPFATLPTGSERIGGGTAAFGLIVPLAVGVSDRIGIGFMTQIDLVEDAGEDDFEVRFINSATIAFDLTERLGVYAELFAERGTDRRARWAVTGDAGLTYALSDNVQLDGGVNVGLTDAADDLNLFIGLSRRF